MSDAEASRVGSMFGPYRLKRLIGRGGMGDVYEAEHTVKEWPCALKLMSETFSQHPVFRERMKREARTAGRLQEPHVVPIHEYGEIDGQMFMEMRLIDGTDLGNLLKRQGPLTPPRAVAIITQITAALDAAHAAEVTHRDVKPANILITPDDFAYLVDFGIASAASDTRLTELGLQVGTRTYMAPEQLSGNEVTNSVDIYALACVLYEALTGSPPRTKDPIPRPSAVRRDIPKAFDAVVARGMAKRPEDRYPSAGDLALAAHEALSHADQDHADTILRISHEATLPDAAPTTPQRPPSRRVITPPSTPVRNPPTPRPAASGPSSGPIQRPARTGPPRVPEGGAMPAAQYWAISSGNRGGPPWGAGPPHRPPDPIRPDPGYRPPSPKKRNTWPIIAGAAAVVVVITLAGIGIHKILQPEPRPTTITGSTTKTTTTTTTTTTAPADAAQSNLLGMLPTGYPSGTCTQYTAKPESIWGSALTAVSCGQNTDPEGPSTATYGLFANANVLQAAFNADVRVVGLQPMNCPGKGPSPDKWYRGNSTVAAGSMACATYNNRTIIIWSDQAKLMLNEVFGDPPDITDLYKWWTSSRSG
jgi:serine/threonine kinase PknH